MVFSRNLKYSPQIDPESEWLLIELASEMGILDLVVASKNVRRFIRKDKPYPEGMIYDNVYNHLCRSIYLLKQIFKGEELKLALSLVLVHDLPEIVSGEKSVLDKTERDEQEEDLAANGMFENLQYLKDLYGQFKSGEDFLKGNIRKYTGDLRIPIIVKAVDRAEGNAYYHVSLFNWLNKGMTDSMDEDALEYMYADNAKIFNLLDLNTKLPDEVRDTVKSILTMPVSLVEELYEGKHEILPDTLKQKMNLL